MSISPLRRQDAHRVSVCSFRRKLFLPAFFLTLTVPALPQYASEASPEEATDAANPAGIINPSADFDSRKLKAQGASAREAAAGPSAAAATAPSTSGVDTTEAAFLTLINNFRAQNGRSPLQISNTLQAASEWMSNDMAVNNRFSHTDSQGRSPFQRMAAFGYSYSPSGENIAAGYDSAQQAFDGWYNACDANASGVCTYAHRVNMLNAGYKAIGIGRVVNSSATYRIYWTTDFGGVVDSSAPVPPTTPDAQAPSQPSFISFAAPVYNRIDLQWRASTDNVGVTRYTVFRNGASLATVNGTTLAYSDTTVNGSASYSYYVIAYDAAGNASLASATATVTTPAAPPPSTGCAAAATNAFTGCYFSNTTLSGAPSVTRTDSAVNFFWGYGSPAPGVPTTNYTVRWSGNFAFQARTYRFNLTTAGGVRIYVDDVLVGQRWVDDGGSYLFYLDRAMTAGTHKITLEYLETYGFGYMALSW